MQSYLIITVLGRHDALKYQVFNNGFPAWCRLKQKYNLGGDILGESV